jgi:formate dehydrogenase maturation protein FdhE
VADRPAPLPRSESREIAELRRLREEQADLASAIDLQIQLLQLQRRVQTRVPLPSISLDGPALEAELAQGRTILAFDALPIDWSDARFLIRSTADAMRTHDAIEPEDYQRVNDLARDSARLPEMVKNWYESGRADGPPAAPEVAGLEALIQQAMRPFLSRCAEAIMARTVFQCWDAGTCPLCGGEPELAVITPAADRLLICGRCTARWRFDQLTCPFCRNADRSRITSFATRDGLYRLYACDVCQRYLKAYDGRHASRPVMPAVDTIATLPLDAAAVQRGYR